ncbi:hypothetical protein Syun_006602 [Stephania yunnanensis]|uniref:Uncharacterized protein n=1 Tax=Stephania yunnanensis TaxID=152371 RepID=A0AAP0KX67_9MAGN
MLGGPGRYHRRPVLDVRESISMQSINLASLKGLPLTNDPPNLLLFDSLRLSSLLSLSLSRCDAMVAPTVAVTEYASTVKTDYASNPVVDGVTLSDGTYAASDASNLGDGSAYSIGQDSVMQEAPASADYEENPTVAVGNIGENLVSQETAVADSIEAESYDSAAIVNGTVDVVAYNAVSHVVNGDMSNNAGGDPVEQQYQGDSGLSPEEERLWSIIRINSLDFSAWTALIEETEKVAEHNPSKLGWTAGKPSNIHVLEDFGVTIARRRARMLLMRIA